MWVSRLSLGKLAAVLGAVVLLLFLSTANAEEGPVAVDVATVDSLLHAPTEPSTPPKEAHEQHLHAKVEQRHHDERTAKSRGHHEEEVVSQRDAQPMANEAVPDNHVERKPTQSKDTVAPIPIVPGSATIRWRATIIPGGCTEATIKYLHHVSEGRSAPQQAVVRARAKVNEAHVQHPEKVMQAKRALAEALAELASFDANVLVTFGANLPKTCITEIDEEFGRMPPPNSDKEFIIAYTEIYRLLAAHLKTIYRPAKGVWLYTLESWAPMFDSFQQFADRYYAKAAAYYYQAHPKPGLIDKITRKKVEVPTSTFLRLTAQGLAYACVPLALLGAMVVVGLLLAPVLVIGVFLNTLIYQIFVRFFIFYWIYAMDFPSDFTPIIKEMFAQAMALDGGAVTDRMVNAFYHLAEEASTVYYNGILMIFFLALSVLLSIVVIWVWASCFMSCGTRKKPRQPPPPAPLNSPAPNPREKKKTK